MTQTYKVQVSMNQAHIVESGFVWKQGDFGFNIEIEVLDFDTTGATPQIIFRKSTGAVEATQISVAGNKFTYAIRGTELDTPGPCVCDLKLNDSTTKRVSTASFKYFVIPDTMDGMEQEASSYSDTIEQLLADVVHLSDTPGLVRNDGTIDTIIENSVEENTSEIESLNNTIIYNRDTECANVDALGNMEANTVVTLNWEHGGIDNVTGETNHDGSKNRSRDVTFYRVNDLVSITNNSTKNLNIIFYEKNGSSYTYRTYNQKLPGESYTFLRNGLYVRFDVRGGLDEAYKIACLGTKYTLVEKVEGLETYSFQYKGKLSNDSDFDDLANQTMYYAENRSYTHGAIAESGLVLTLADKSNVALQIFITTSNYNKRIFARRKTNSGWGVWGNLQNNFVANLTNNSSLDTPDFGTTYFKPSDLTITNDPCPSKSGLVYTLGNPDGVGQQLLITTSSSGNVIYVRRHLTAGWGPWENIIPEIPESRKEISILFVGNSLTQDGIAYLPYLLKNYYPDVNFKLYMWYNGGYTLGQQYSAFTNGDKAAIFSIAENTAAWTNYNGSKTMEWVLSNCEFDIVSLQEYFNYKESYTESDLIDWNNCRDYISAHYTGGNGLEFISLFHAPLRSSADTVFARTVAGNNLILQKTVADDMIPNGIGIYRALSTSLDDLGDQEHLSPDGTHTQEGLPCLLQTYVTACWLFDRLGMGRSVYGCPLRITEAILDTINVPGPNPNPYAGHVITGTDAENLLAQEIAIKAYKEGKYYVMNNQYIPPSN